MIAHDGGPVSPWSQADYTSINPARVALCAWVVILLCMCVWLPAVLPGPSPATCCRGCWRTCSSAGPSGRRAASRCRPCGCCSGPPGSWQPPSCGAGPAKTTWSRRWCRRWTGGPHGPRRRPGCGNPAGTPHLQQRSWDPFSSLDLKSGEGSGEIPGRSRVTGTVQTGTTKNNNRRNMLSYKLKARMKQAPWHVWILVRAAHKQLAFKLLFSFLY